MTTRAFVEFAGKFAELTIGRTTIFVFVFVLEFALARRRGVGSAVTSEFDADDVELQPKFAANIKSAEIKSNTRNIILNNLFCFKNINADLNVAPLGDSDGVQIGTGRC